MPLRERLQHLSAALTRLDERVDEWATRRGKSHPRLDAASSAYRDAGAHGADMVSTVPGIPAIGFVAAVAAFISHKHTSPGLITGTNDAEPKPAP